MMNDFQFPIQLPLDSDGFLRRECPNCIMEFKWFHHLEGDTNVENVDQYFCPLCGIGAGTQSWWTQAQLEYIAILQEAIIDKYVVESMNTIFKQSKRVSLTLNKSFQSETETLSTLSEQDDMFIVEMLCHPNEPIKVQDGTREVHCLVCGSKFAI